MSVSNDVKLDIMNDLVEPCYYIDVKNLISECKFWRQIGDIFTTTSKICVGGTSILSFASGIYKYDTLIFIAGTVSVLSLSCMQFSSYAYSESKERTSKLNKILKQLGMDTVPDISNHQSFQSRESQQQQSNRPHQPPLQPLYKSLNSSSSQKGEETQYLRSRELRNESNLSKEKISDLEYENEYMATRSKELKKENELILKSEKTENELFRKNLDTIICERNRIARNIDREKIKIRNLTNRTILAEDVSKEPETLVIEKAIVVYDNKIEITNEPTTDDTTDLK